MLSQRPSGFHTWVHNFSLSVPIVASLVLREAKSKTEICPWKLGSGRALRINLCWGRKEAEGEDAQRPRRNKYLSWSELWTWHGSAGWSQIGMRAQAFMPCIKQSPSTGCPWEGSKVTLSRVFSPEQVPEKDLAESRTYPLAWRVDGGTNVWVLQGDLGENRDSTIPTYLLT